MREYGFSLTRIFQYKEEYRRIRFSENPFSRMFYAVIIIILTIKNWKTTLSDYHNFNAFVANAPFLYPLKTSEKVVKEKFGKTSKYYENDGRSRIQGEVWFNFY